MICNRCGSTKFDEQNGLFYCSYCQTQSQVFINQKSKLLILLKLY